MDGSQLYELLLARYGSQHKIAAALQVSQPVICYWKRTVPGKYTARVRSLLGIEPDAPPSSDAEPSTANAVAFIQGGQ